MEVQSKSNAPTLSVPGQSCFGFNLTVLRFFFEAKPIYCRYSLPSLRNGVLFALAWVAWVACLRGWRASMGGVDGVLAWVAWVACLRGWRDSVGGVGGVLAWVAC